MLEYIIFLLVGSGFYFQHICLVPSSKTIPVPNKVACSNSFPVYLLFSQSDAVDIKKSTAGFQYMSRTVLNKTNRKMLSNQVYRIPRLLQKSNNHARS